MIYFIRDAAFGAIKVGFTLNLENRVDALEGTMKRKLEIIGIIKGDQQDEKRLHAKFSDLHLQGEWFRETPEFINEINLLVQKIPHDGSVESKTEYKPVNVGSGNGKMGRPWHGHKKQSRKGSQSMKNKRPSGGAQLKASGKTGVLIGLTQEELAILDAACATEGRSRANFLVHYGIMAAKKKIEKSGK